MIVNDIKTFSFIFGKRHWCYRCGRKSFSFQSRCITALFEKCFSKFNTENIKQINIFCVKGSPKLILTIIDGFCDVEIDYDVNEFFNLADQEEKRGSIGSFKARH